MKKILLIGAGGFIGSALKKAFDKDHTVTPLYRGDINLLSHDDVKELLMRTNPDIIINAYTSGGKSKVRDTDLDIVSDNLIAFDNFRRSKHLFGKYINIGSGAEFTTPGECREEDILKSIPITSYGLSKNLISRMCLHEPNFYTLRLFGCFGTGEPEFRLFTKFMMSKDVMYIDDKYFDNISINDFIKIMKVYVTNLPPHKDINCVYQQKLLISEQLNQLSEVTGHTRTLVIKRGDDYIGSSTRLMSLGLSLTTLEKSELEQYND